ncbi:MAG: PKD domain-containing protein [Bacteroidales bacterium]|nr:PKD domain-containing protein [Bacteroidales bacterium]
MRLYIKKIAWITLLVIAETGVNAQMLADFETPETSPGFYAEGSTSIVDNPDTTGINKSDKVGYYNKISGNWHFVSLQFPDTIKVRYNNTLTFKLRTSTQGRIFAKFYIGSQFLIENWAPTWQFQPEPDTWVECTMDMTNAMHGEFTLLQLAACVDNDAEADVWFDDVKLSNPEAGDGSPHILFSISGEKVTTGDPITFDASGSYDYDGEIVGYHWNFDDGTTDSGEIVIHTFTHDSVFSPTLTITDNDGKTATLSQYVFVFPADGKLSAPRILTLAPETNKKIEIIFHVNRIYDNVYDPDEVKIDAVITYPDGDTAQIPCFYYIGTKYRNGQWTTEPEFQVWMLRFISEQDGDHALKLKILDNDVFEETNAYHFNVSPGATKGVIRPDSINKQYFRHSTGEPFYPLGINAAWNSIEDYTQIINNLSQGQANVFRYWHTPFARQALEWDEDFYHPYDGLGIYSQEAAAMSDSLLELCEAKDIYMQLAIFQHGPFSENVNPMWATNPYNSANGGFVDRAEKYFYNSECKAQTKKLLRYIVARWAWSKNLFAWEFFNEVQFTGIHNSQTAAWFPGVLQWHSEMSRYMKSIDPYGHLQTTSAADDQLPLLDTVATLDNLQYHLYYSEPYLLETQAGLDYRFRDELLNSSVVNGEYGTRDGADVPFDMQRHAIWNGIMTQVPRYMWIWDHYLQSSWAGLFTMPAEYLADEDFSREEDLQDYDVTLSHPTKELKSYGLSTGKNYYGYIYDPDNETNISQTKITIPDLPLANYDLTWYLPVSGEIIKYDSIAPFFSSNSLEHPAFSKGLAFKLKYLSEYIAPLAVAGNDTVIPIGGTARLSARLSSPNSSDTLTCLWRIDKKPVFSLFELTDSTSSSIEISPDAPGTYKLSLIVNDGKFNSRPDEILVRVSWPPVAVAGNDTSLYPEETYLRLDGSESYDPDGDIITFEWVLLSVPPGSDSILTGGEQSGIAALQIDAEGTYIIELTVNDGYQNSLPDIIVVTVLGTGETTITQNQVFGVFPNPASGKLFISSAGNEHILFLELIDLQGRILYHSEQRDSNPGLYEIDMTKWVGKSGLVFLKITGEEHTETWPVLFQDQWH